MKRIVLRSAAIVALIGFAAGTAWLGERSARETTADTRGDTEADAALLALRKLPITEPVEGGIVVRIVSESGTPCGGADVFCTPEADLVTRHPAEVGSFLPDLENWIAPLATRYRTDASGETRIAHDSDRILIAVHAEAGTSAARWAEGERAPFTIAVGPERRVRVLVVDDDDVGVPGMTVSLNPLQELESARMTRVTGTNGFVTLGCLSRLLRGVSPGRVDQATVSIAVPSPSAGSASVDLRNPPRDFVVLRQREGGTLRITVVDRSGAPIREETPITVAPRGRSQDDGKAGRSSGNPPRMTRSDGTLTLERVPLGFEMEVTVTADEYSPAKTKIKGPTHAGETIDVAVAVGAAVPVVRFRVAAVSGRALASRGFQLRCEDRDVSGTVVPRRSTPQTDSEGFARFAWRDVSSSLARPPAFVEITMLDGRCGLIELPATLAVGINDLADVVVRETAVVAEGWVIDGDDRPVEDASVSVVHLSARAGDRPLEFCSKPPTRTGLDGHFAVRSWLPDPFALRITKSGSRTVLTKPVARNGAPQTYLLGR